MKQTIINIIHNTLGALVFITAFFFACDAVATEYDVDKIGPYGMTQIDRVYDGDTFYGWAQTFIYQTTYMKIRIRSIDTPEIRGSGECEKKMAYAARDYLMSLLANAKSVTLDDLGYDNFGRVLASVHADNVNVAAKMISSGHGRPYIKGASGGWCLRG